ncbi:MAG: hypothetical protein LAN63_13200 [Acidobacteriia bacterium]|nr:hypothetical protein [Terriglobia bacterium]
MGKPELPRTKERASTRIRVAEPLPGDTDKRLRAYALAASAAGVGLLALAPPAYAEIIYTPTHIKLTNGRLVVDLTNSGTENFLLTDTTESHSGYAYTRELEINGSSNASVIGGDHKGVTVLHAGSVIGSSRSFQKVSGGEGLLAGASVSGYGFYSRVYGNWANVRRSYMGLKFIINGEVHYGWAELSVLDRIDKHHGLNVGALLLGYAYETTPNLPIKAGQTNGGEAGTVSPNGFHPRPKTLGALARGAAK